MLVAFSGIDQYGENNIFFNTLTTAGAVFPPDRMYIISP